MQEYSARAKEVADDLFSEIDTELRAGRQTPASVRFHLDASDMMLSRPEAEQWVRRSVDEGFPNVRYYIEHANDLEAVVNLAAFEDPDSQYYP